MVSLKIIYTLYRLLICLRVRHFDGYCKSGRSKSYSLKRNISYKKRERTLKWLFNETVKITSFAWNVRQINIRKQNVHLIEQMLKMQMLKFLLLLKTINGIQTMMWLLKLILLFIGAKYIWLSSNKAYLLCLQSIIFKFKLQKWKWFYLLFILIVSLFCVLISS